MWPHFVNLLGRSWDALTKASGTTTLGILVWTIAIAIASWAAATIAKWLELKKDQARSPFRSALHDSTSVGKFTAAAIGTLIFFVFLGFMVRTVYRDHEELVAKVRELDASKTMAEVELEDRKSSISTGDPVFPNIIYMLQTFHIFRRARNGELGVIMVTAPKDSFSLASVVAQFSNSVSDCSTFGPIPPGDSAWDKQQTTAWFPM
jgi:hypothetical protein